MTIEILMYIFRCRCLKGHPLQVRHKQDWRRGFIFLPSQASVLSGSDASSDVVKSALIFFCKIVKSRTPCGA